MNELTELEKIYKKNLSEMNNVELAIWFTAEGTTAYDMDEAADYLARITAERDALDTLAKRAIDLYSDRCHADFGGASKAEKARVAELRAALKQSSRACKLGIDKKTVL